jgi:hypothetical protein
MTKYLFLFLIFFSFLEKNTAQEGILAIARYGQNEAPKFRYNDSLTEFSGGFKAFKNLFLKEFKMPVKALRGRKASDGMVGFTVNLVGKIVDIEVIDSVTTEIDAEVVRVLSEIAEFHPQAKPLKFAIQYNVFPDWFRDWVEEEEATEKRMRQLRQTDSLLRSIEQQDLLKYVDKDKAYFSGDVWAGFSTMNDPLSKYLKTAFVLGFDIGIFKNNWFFGGHLQLRGLSTKQEFVYKDVVWLKDTSVNLPTLGLTVGYKIVDEDRLAFTPFVGIGGGFLNLPAQEDYMPPEGAGMGSFIPSFGFLADYKYKVKASKSMFEQPKLNTKVIRLRLAVNPMNFKEWHKGNVVDLGIGIGFYDRLLKLN